jgi:simple sugar transport system substrate-binding protein/ribose transport system substrate-binding protein
VRSLIIAAALALGATAAAAAELPTIAGIVFQQDQYMHGVELGMTAAAKGRADLLLGNSENKAEKEASLVATYVTRGAKALMIAPISQKASLRTLERAHAKGVRIITWGTTIPGDIPVTFIGTSNSAIGNGTGKVASAFIQKELGGKATVAIIAFRSQLPEQSDARVNGFLDEAKKGTTLDIVARQDAWLAEKAIAVVSDVLTAHPDINVIYAANEGGTVGAVQAVRRAGKEGKVFVFGTDGSEQLASFLEDPDRVLIATTAQQPLKVGAAAVDAAMLALAGKPVEKHVEVAALPLSRMDEAGVKAYLADLKASE